MLQFESIFVYRIPVTEIRSRKGVMKAIIWMSLVLISYFVIDYLNLDQFAKWAALVYSVVGLIICVKELRYARR